MCRNSPGVKPLCSTATRRPGPTACTSACQQGGHSSHIGIPTAITLVGVAGTPTFQFKDGNVLTLGPGTFGYWPGQELMQAECDDDGPCVYYDQQIDFGDVHFDHSN